jgi:hypothetical protein
MELLPAEPPAPPLLPVEVGPAWPLPLVGVLLPPTVAREGSF